MTNFTLTLIKTSDGNYLLQGVCPGEELEYYACDGEGGEATKIGFTPWNEDVEIVPNVRSAKYDSDDSDSFWEALDRVLKSAKRHGIRLPDYVDEDYKLPLNKQFTTNITTGFYRSINAAARSIQNQGLGSGGTIYNEIGEAVAQLGPDGLI